MVMVVVATTIAMLHSLDGGNGFNVGHECGGSSDSTRNGIGFDGDSNHEALEQRVIAKARVELDACDAARRGRDYRAHCMRP